MHILGNTLSEIAQQKVGIIHKNNSVYAYEQNAEIDTTIHNRAKEMNANLSTFSFVKLENLKSKDIAGLPDFQKRNWLLAEEVTKAIANRDNFTYVPLQHPELVIVPGRMDTVVLRDGSILVMDGAHNEQKMEAFVSSFAQKYQDSKATVLLALKEGKEYKEVLDVLKSVSNEIILTTFSTSQDLPAVSQDPETLQKYCKSIGLSSIIIEDRKLAFMELLNRNTKYKIVTGSFYLLGQVRYLLKL
jgi:dihydrofolate synthase/folylpolyglutamate synthase